MILMPTTFSTQNWRLRNGIFASVILSFFVTLTACEDPQEIGSEVFAQDIGVLYTDTLTVDASTVLIDSILTTGTSSLLVGRTTDPSLGSVEASSYFHIVPFDTLYSFVDTAGRKNVKWIRFPSKVDSIRFFLPYNYYEGDTNQRQTIKVMQLAESAVLDVDKQYYSNSPAPALSSRIIGQAQNVRIRPVKNNTIISGTGRFDTLRIPITDPAFISFIASQRDPKKDLATVGTEFRRATRGFALTSESVKNAAVLGFDAVYALMRVYYNYKYTYTLRNKANTADSITVTVDTTKSNILQVFDREVAVPKNVRFNKITAVRTGTLAKLTKVTDALPSKEANGEVYIQNASGLIMKVQFPSLTKLKERKDIAINKAELVLEPNANPNNFTLPTDLVLVESTKDNRIARNTKDATGSMRVVSGESSSATYQSRTNSFTFNVTSSLQNILSGRNPSNGWLISPTIFTTNTQGQRGLASGSKILSSDASRAVLNTKNIKLKVYYTYVSK
jgi:Domain of unknown function (DUF4270)